MEAMQDSSPTILIVEDDMSLSNLYQQKFEKEGFKVLVAHDGDMGVKLATDNLPDFVMLDNMLPKMSGLEVLRILKSNEKTKNIPAMVLSNLTVKEEKEKALELGALDYLAKAGQSPEEIVEKVRGYISK